MRVMTRCGTRRSPDHRADRLLCRPLEQAYDLARCVLQIRKVLAAKSSTVNAFLIHRMFIEP